MFQLTIRQSSEAASAFCRLHSLCTQSRFQYSLNLVVNLQVRILSLRKLRHQTLGHGFFDRRMHHFLSEFHTADFLCQQLSSLVMGFHRDRWCGQREDAEIDFSRYHGDIFIEGVVRHIQTATRRFIPRTARILRASSCVE